jgi:hypothetical protein
MVAIPESIDWGYLNERVRRYNENPSDDLLYRLGTHIDVLSVEDCQSISQQGFTSEQRYRVLNWLACCTDLLNDEMDLALLIFGRNQLEQWLERSRQAYPDYEFYLVFEYQDKAKTGWESGINFTMHWVPLPGAPVPDIEYDFPWRSCWDSGEMFWCDYCGYTNHFDFNLHCYPNQASFTKPGWVCEAGDYYTSLDERDANLMSVAQVLERFATSV